jgi:hypothetical protein
MRGLSQKEFAQILDEPTTKSDKYMYQLNVKLDKIIELLSSSDVEKSIKQDVIIEEVIPAPKKRTSRKKSK